METLADLTQAVCAFRDERGWAQFHNLKDLMLSVSLEAAEVLELSQWKNEAEMARFCDNPENREALCDECADVLIYLLLLAERGGIDLTKAVAEKLAKNAAKYPAEKSGHHQGNL